MHVAIAFIYRIDFVKWQDLFGQTWLQQDVSLSARDTAPEIQTYSLFVQPDIRAEQRPDVLARYLKTQNAMSLQKSLEAQQRLSYCQHTLLWARESSSKS